MILFGAPEIAMSTTKMQTQAPTSSLRCSKRKRTAVSYAETDLNDDVLFNAEQEEQEDEDDDAEFGKRQKVS